MQKQKALAFSCGHGESWDRVEPAGPLTPVTAGFTSFAEQRDSSRRFSPREDEMARIESREQPNRRMKSPNDPRRGESFPAAEA